MDKDDDGLPRSYRWHEKLGDWNDAIHKREDNVGFWLGVLFVSPVLTSLQWLNRRFSNWTDDQWEKRRLKRDERSKSGGAGINADPERTSIFAFSSL